MFPKLENRLRCLYRDSGNQIIWRSELLQHFGVRGLARALYPEQTAVGELVSWGRSARHSVRIMTWRNSTNLLVGSCFEPCHSIDGSQLVRGAFPCGGKLCSGGFAHRYVSELCNFFIQYTNNWSCNDEKSLSQNRRGIRNSCWNRGNSWRFLRSCSLSFNIFDSQFGLIPHLGNVLWTQASQVRNALKSHMCLTKLVIALWWNGILVSLNLFMGCERKQIRTYWFHYSESWQF